MTVLRAWAPLFWSGVLVGLVHTIIDTLGADPPTAIVYGSGVLLAASAVPVLIGLVHGLVVGRRAGAEDRAGDPRLAPVARLVAGRVRGAVAVLIEPERRTEGAWGTGETARYSNFGVALLGHALARAAGRGYADLIAERILHPLDLRETAVATLDQSDPRAARGHDQFAFGVRPWDLAAIAPAGGIVSTAADMARWLEAQTRPDSTPLAGAIRMTHEPRVPLQPSAIGRLLGSGLQGSRVGLAWITTDVEGREVVWHNGGTGGFGSFIGFGPDSGRGIVVLTNSTHARRLDETGLALVSGG